MGIVEAVKYMDKLYNNYHDPIGDDAEKFDREHPEMAQKFAEVIVKFVDDMEKLCLEMRAPPA